MSERKKSRMINSTKSKSKHMSESNKKSDSMENSKIHNQVLSIIIFALSILLICLVVIKGENVWLFLHNFILGLFGTAAILWPLLLFYVAVTTASSQPKNKVGVKVILSVIVIFLFCTFVYIFRNNADFLNLNYFKSLIELYKQGTLNHGAGFFSGILGIPMVLLFGDVGGKIIITLLLFVSIMLLTGTTLGNLYEVLKNIYEFISCKIKEKILSQKKDSSTDENLPANQVGLPAHPVKSNLILNDISTDDNINKHVVNSKDDLMENSAAMAAKAFFEKSKGKEKESEEFKASEVKMIPDKSDDSSYNYPPVSLLEPTREQSKTDIRTELQTNGQMLVDTLNSFSVQTKIVDISRGPAVTRYELQPAAGVKISKITNLADDIALNLAASGVRIEAPIPGKAAVGIEIPNKIVSVVKMRELINADAFMASKSKLTVILGRDIAGNVTVADLAKMPHLLIAGSTGSGKSVCINSFIISLLYKANPDEVRLLMVDPKVVELGIYNGIPHLLVPVVTDPRKAAGALNWAVTEMLKRYNIFAENNVRDLTAYNKMVQNKLKSGDFKNDDEKLEMMPQIVIIIDELADLMMAAPNEVEDAICRLAQMARAAGMHLVIATQRPSVDVITGTIKANIPSRIALSVSSQIDSRTILDASGAEKLLGRGDMLFSPVGSAKPIRIQGCYLTDKEIEDVLNFIKNNGENEYDQTVIDEIEKNTVSEVSKSDQSDNDNQDPMLDEAIRCVIEAGQASTSLLQRRLRLGYARAGRLIDEMERMGIIGPHEGSKPRQVLIKNQQFISQNPKE